MESLFEFTRLSPLTFISRGLLYGAANHFRRVFNLQGIEENWKDPELGNSKNEENMGIVDAAVIIIFCVFLPFFDVYSDILIIYTLFRPRCYKSSTVLAYVIKKQCLDNGGEFHAHPNFGWAMISPVFISFMFTIPHWIKQEEHWKQRFQTLPFLLLQIYSPMKMVQILYIGLWKKDKNWKVKKEALEKEIGCLEPFLESIPQNIILLCLAAQEEVLKGKLFWTTMGLSFASACFAITKFLKIGPCKLIPSCGILGGYYSKGFLLVFVNVVLTYFIKGYYFQCKTDGFTLKRVNSFDLISHWALLNVIPQLVFALFILFMAIGIRNTIRLSLRYPEFLLMPIFSFWTFGLYHGDRICISYQLTWMNAIITIIAWIFKLFYEEISPNYYFVLFLLVNIDMIFLYYAQYNLETRNDHEEIHFTILNVNNMQEESEEDIQNLINDGETVSCPSTVCSRLLFYIILLYNILILAKQFENSSNLPFRSCVLSQ